MGLSSHLPISAHVAPCWCTSILFDGSHRGCLARGARGAGARCDFSPVGVEWRYHGMLPQSGHRGPSIAFSYPIIVFAWGPACRGPKLGSRHLVDSKFSVSPPLLSTGHMAMNADLLAPGSSVFYLRGTTGERVPATVVGLSSFPECVAINYERSGHTQYYCNCPVARLTFPIVRVDSPDSDWRVPQGLVMTQVMRMAPHALTILARTTHRCPYISPFCV